MRSTAYQYADKDDYDIIFGEVMGVNRVAYPKYMIEKGYNALVVRDDYVLEDGNECNIVLTFYNSKTSDKLSSELSLKHDICNPAEFLELKKDKLNFGKDL